MGTAGPGHHGAHIPATGSLHLPIAHLSVEDTIEPSRAGPGRTSSPKSCLEAPACVRGFPFPTRNLVLLPDHFHVPNDKYDECEDANTSLARLLRVVDVRKSAVGYLLTIPKFRDILNRRRA